MGATYRLLSVTAHADEKREVHKRRKTSRANTSETSRPLIWYPTPAQKEACACGMQEKHTVLLMPFEQADPAGASHCAKGCHQQITKTSQPRKPIQHIKENKRNTRQDGPGAVLFTSKCFFSFSPSQAGSCQVIWYHDGTLSRRHAGITQVSLLQVIW
jgi:hypothetical protein